MAITGDRLESYATMLDGVTPITGLTITILNARDPSGNELDEDRLTTDELGNGIYVVYYQTVEGDPAGTYALTYQFDDEFDSIWTEEEWVLSGTQTIYPVTAPPAQTGTPLNVSPHMRDADDTHDSQYYKRGEETIPGPHVHMDAGTVVAFGESDSIKLQQSGNTLFAVAKFGTTAASIAEGDKLAAKLEADDVADVALSGDYTDLTNIPSTFTPASHTHSGTEIVSGTIPVARLPTGTSGSTVAWGNHGHVWPEIWNIPIGYLGGPAITAASAYVDIVIPSNRVLSGNWTVLAMGPSGAIQFDLWVQDYGSFPPLVANTMIGGGGTKPRILATSNKGQGDYTGWSSTLLLKGQVLRIYVDSCTTIQQATLALEYLRVV